MKKTKRFLAVLVSLLVLVAGIPFGAYAAGAISSVDVELNVVPGVDAENYEEYVTVNTEGIEPFNDEEGSAILVFDEEDNFVSGQFQMGETYHFTIFFITKPGYSFPGSEFEFQGVTINGESVEYYLEHIEYDDELIGLLMVEYEISLGGEVSEIVLDTNVYSDMPVSEYYRYIEITSQGVDFVANSNSAVKVFDSEGNEVKDSFEAGKEYKLEIYIEPKTNCNFSKNENGDFTIESVTVNGEEAEYTANSYTTNADYEYVKIVTTVTAKEAKYISAVDFEIADNLDGVAVENCEDYITIKTEGLKFESYLDDPAVFVTDSYGNITENFADGEIYYMYIYFSPEEGYFFPYDEVLDSVTVNGEDYSDNYYFSSYTAEDGKEIYFMCVEMELDLVGNGFFARLTYFFRTLFNWIQMLFFGIAI